MSFNQPSLPQIPLTRRGHCVHPHCSGCGAFTVLPASAGSLMRYVCHTFLSIIYISSDLCYFHIRSLFLRRSCALYAAIRGTVTSSRPLSITFPLNVGTLHVAGHLIICVEGSSQCVLITRFAHMLTSSSFYSSLFPGTRRCHVSVVNSGVCMVYQMRLYHCHRLPIGVLLFFIDHSLSADSFLLSP